jgi:hypothetical protein
LRCPKICINRKAVTTFALALILIVGVSLFALGMVTLYRYRIRIHIIDTYKLEYISDVLPTVLSSTYNGKRVSELLGEYLALGGSTADNDVKNVPDVLKSKLDLVLSSDCYRLYTDDFDVRSDNWDSDFCKSRRSIMTTARVVLPYSEKSVKQIILLSKSTSLNVIGE